MLKIRLARIGAKKKPFYRVVVVDERAKRTGVYLELLGTYNPLTEPKNIKLKQDRIDYWIKQGAQPSTGYLRIIGKAPQRPPRKPKKAIRQVTVDSGQTKAEEPKDSEKTEEPQPAEEVKLSEPEATEATSDGGHVPSGTGDFSEVNKTEEALAEVLPSQAGEASEGETETENERPA